VVSVTPSASGAEHFEDIANVRLRFANGCVANLTASRVNPERLRKIRVFSAAPAPCYVSLDYRLRRVSSTDWRERTSRRARCGESCCRRKTRRL